MSLCGLCVGGEVLRSVRLLYCVGYEVLGVGLLPAVNNVLRVAQAPSRRPPNNTESRALGIFLGFTNFGGVFRLKFSR